jgi:ankyrin repeat protein
LDKGSDVNASDDSGATALLRAAGGGPLQAVKMLLDKGADFGARDSDVKMEITSSPLQS